MFRLWQPMLIHSIPFLRMHTLRVKVLWSQRELETPTEPKKLHDQRPKCDSPLGPAPFAKSNAPIKWKTTAARSSQTFSHTSYIARKNVDFAGKERERFIQPCEHIQDYRMTIHMILHCAHLTFKRGASRRLRSCRRHRAAQARHSVLPLRDRNV